ncbi:MAG: glucose-1-phosphate cytidylyltransferase [Acidobacteria bacterium]|nr:MAG: glucose-1-phosphate cytidylyltransferase [Acidobacteriota bacterium]
MKVVLFCGGLGMRLREFSETIPKPMINIGHRPILWQVMRYYAHYGHKEFILCLGYKGELIKEYFLTYKETMSNDFVLSQGGRRVELLSSDIHDWRITFVNTGLTSNIGQRLKAIQSHLEGEDVFLANYTDLLSDLPLPELLKFFHEHSKVGCFISVPPTQSFHLVSSINGGLVQSIKHVAEAEVRINGGFFVLKKQIFDYIKNGEDLVHEPFQRLINEKQLITYKHDGFWACMDTFKERQLLEDMYTRAQTPWEVWKPNSGTRGDETVPGQCCDASL